MVISELAIFLELVLWEEGLMLDAEEDDKYDMTIRVAEGNSSAEEIESWIKTRITSPPK
jgi:prophage maintenance system killer protein